MRFSTIILIVVIVGGGSYYAWRQGYFGKVKEAAEANHNVHFDRGERLYLTQKYDEAIKEFRMCIALEPGSSKVPISYMRCGDCYKELRQPEKAIEMYQKVLEHDPDARIRGQVEQSIEKVTALGHF